MRPLLPGLLFMCTAERTMGSVVGGGKSRAPILGFCLSGAGPLRRGKGRPPLAVPFTTVAGFVGTVDASGRRIQVISPRRYRCGDNSVIGMVSKRFRNIAKGITQVTKRRHIIIRVSNLYLITATCVPSVFVRHVTRWWYGGVGWVVVGAFQVVVPLLVLVFIFSYGGRGISVRRFITRHSSVLRSGEDGARRLSRLGNILDAVTVKLSDVTIRRGVLFGDEKHSNMHLSGRRVTAQLGKVTSVLTHRETGVRILRSSLTGRGSSRKVRRLREMMRFLGRRLTRGSRVVGSLQTSLGGSGGSVARLHTSLSSVGGETAGTRGGARILAATLSGRSSVVGRYCIGVKAGGRLSTTKLLGNNFLRGGGIGCRSVSGDGFGTISVHGFHRVALGSGGPGVLAPRPDGHSFRFRRGKSNGYALMVAGPAVF